MILLLFLYVKKKKLRSCCLLGSLPGQCETFFCPLAIQGVPTTSLDLPRV